MNLLMRLVRGLVFGLVWLTGFVSSCVASLMFVLPIFQGKEESLVVVYSSSYWWWVICFAAAIYGIMAFVLHGRLGARWYGYQTLQQSMAEN